MPTLRSVHTQATISFTISQQFLATNASCHMVAGIAASSSSNWGTVSMSPSGNLFTELAETSTTASMGYIALYAAGTASQVALRAIKATTGTQRSYVIEVDDVTSFDRFTANYSYISTTARTATINLDITAGVSKYLVAVYQIMVGSAFANGFSVTSGGELSWSLISGLSGLVTAVAHIGFAVEIPANTTSSAQIVIGTTGNGRPCLPTIYAFDYTAAQSYTPQVPGVGNVNALGLAPGAISVRRHGNVRRAWEGPLRGRRKDWVAEDDDAVLSALLKE